ncbi:hypothetical protein ANANG_G00243450 [Anguilla anguilla]|uniref:Uncharacterized protein n=1 Tax=Anguilla anguilla TaxID=7936 RepID=A0A9D3RM07_ANGAN|nr:hypothetical protein ANANG_G00243450 [Anguilla anguilla]
MKTILLTTHGRPKTKENLVPLEQDPCVKQSKRHCVPAGTWHASAGCRGSSATQGHARIYCATAQQRALKYQGGQRAISGDERSGERERERAEHSEQLTGLESRISESS